MRPLQAAKRTAIITSRTAHVLGSRSEGIYRCIVFGKRACRAFFARANDAPISRRLSCRCGQSDPPKGNHLPVR